MIDERRTASISLPPRPSVGEGRGGGRFIIHDLAHAYAALAAASALGLPVTLRSAPDAAAHLGAGAFIGIVEEARRDYPDVSVTAVLDCGDAPGHALGALRIGIKIIRLTAAPELRRKVGDIARQYGACLDENEAPALDLLDVPDPEAAARNWLARTGTDAFSRR